MSEPMTAAQEAAAKLPPLTDEQVHRIAALLLLAQAGQHQHRGGR